MKDNEEQTDSSIDKNAPSRKCAQSEQIEEKTNIIKEGDILRKFSENINSCKDINQVSNLLIELAESVFSFAACSIYLIDERINQFELISHKNFSEEYKKMVQSQIEEGIIDWIIRGGKPKVVENIFADKGAGKSPVRSLVICPFISGGRVQGAFILLSVETSKSFEAEKLELLAMLCGHASVYLENMKLSKTVSKRAKQLSLLSETSKNINSVLDLKALLVTILNEAARELRAQMGYIMLAEENKLILKVSRNSVPYKNFKRELPIGSGVSGWVAKARKPLLITDYVHDPRFKSGNEFDGFRIKTVISVPIMSKGDLIGIITICNKEKDFPFTKENLEIISSLADQAGIAIINAKLFEDLERGYFETISALAASIEAKDPYTRGHSQRVTTYCTAIANAMNLPEEQKRLIQYAAVLHDVGKIGISDSIIGKPSPLTNEEFKTIKKHPEIGDEIASTITFLKDGRKLIRHHHERYDGKGYPDGLAGEEISLIARIASVADSYDAMATNRPYDEAWPKEKTIARLLEVAGSQLDPKIVGVFVDLLRNNKV